MQNLIVGQEIDSLAQRIDTYLNTLCITIPDRPVGSQGNQDAVDFFAKTVRAFGFETECKPFDCFDWTYGKVSLKAGQENFQAFVGPYSLSCDVSAPLIKASTHNQLEKTDCSNKILILHGDIAKEQMMPKNFPFYNPENHQRVIALLEHKKPAAIIAATGKNSEAVGALYPFPLFEDGAGSA